MPFVVFAYLAVQILIVAYHDFQTKKISNKWSLINIGFYVFFTLIFPEYYTFSLETFIWPLGFFVAGFILFLMKIMGGGDSKYLASFYLLIPSQFHEQAFFSLAIATVLVGGSVFTKNIMKNADLIMTAFKNKDIKLVRSIFGKKFAFAPVIFISWIWFGWIIKEKILF
ncbi:prepilin peptidase [Bacteriovorax sp. Seq25_V]|uniref:prepilin peptidase n=1 Tax=Bacteriovorax sp. Seq25_V TaxID=1201288 RepID=UPI00038A021B|nr:prepilin peptidase [Bacteriovorax sp. Seq25_V]EQC43311.1 peptidase, A24 type IV prepilin peptidase family protein [Bacteriovorax sp. Seq25_V]